MVLKSGINFDRAVERSKQTAWESTSTQCATSNDDIKQYAAEKKKPLQINSTTVETEPEKEKKMIIYRKLLAKRTELAFSLDCMPYMIASNEVLMNLSQMKPRSVEELKRYKCNILF